MKQFLVILLLFFSTVSSLRASETVDANFLGFSPSAPASENVTALQKALDGGKKTVLISKPGVYEMNATVYIDDETVLKCEPGVILKKVASYSFVVTNRGVLDRTWNHDLTVENLQISANKFSTCPGIDSLQIGMRGQLNFFRVKNLVVKNYKILDVVGAQYALQICEFENILVDGFEFRGAKDGVHLGGPAKNFVVRNGVCATGDDGLALNMEDYPTSNPTQGTLRDGLIENVELSGFGGRLLTGAWVDWHDGILLQNGDTVRNGKNVYRVVASHSTEEHVSHKAPTHDQGTWLDEESGLKFIQNTADGADRASIINVTFRNIVFHSGGMNAWWESGPYHRAVHPEVKPENLPICDVRFENCEFRKEPRNGGRIVGGNSNMKIVLDGVKSNCSFFSCDGHAKPVNFDLTIQNTTFPRDDTKYADVLVRGKVTGSVTLEKCELEREPRINVPESVTVKANTN